MYQFVSIQFSSRVHQMLLQVTKYHFYRVPNTKLRIPSKGYAFNQEAMCTVHCALCYVHAGCVHFQPESFQMFMFHSDAHTFEQIDFHFFCDYHSRRLTMTIKMFKCSIICNFMHLEMKSMKNTSNFEHCTISAAFSHNFQISIHYWRRTFHQGLKFNTNTNIINHL